MNLPSVSPRQLQRHRGGGDYPLQLPAAQGEGQSQQQLQLGLAGKHLLVFFFKQLVTDEIFYIKLDVSDFYIY